MPASAEKGCFNSDQNCLNIFLSNHTQASKCAKCAGPRQAPDFPVDHGSLIEIEEDLEIHHAAVLL